MLDAHHEGERAVQDRTGERAIADRNGVMLSDTIMVGGRPFLAQQRMLAVASADADGQVWASLLFGEPGFASSADGRLVTVDRVQLTPDPDEVMWTHLRPGASLGILAIELGSRRRLRINGTVTAVDPRRLEVSVAEAYPNCPKYIQRRHLRVAEAAREPSPGTHGQAFDAARVALIQGADTLFVGSQHPTRGLDASHRGGAPGFVRVLHPDTLRIPDYPGNSLFNTLGNLSVWPRVGLAIPDFDAGRLLQLVGTVTLHFDAPEAPGHPTGGTGRYWDVHVERWTERALPAHLSWELLDASRFNPSPVG